MLHGFCLFFFDCNQRDGHFILQKARMLSNVSFVACAYGSFACSDCQIITQHAAQTWMVLACTKKLSFKYFFAGQQQKIMTKVLKEELLKNRFFLRFDKEIDCPRLDGRAAEQTL